MAFEESFADVPRHYADGGDLILSHVGSALSSVFPDGEDFFVRSVRHYRDRITDPDLKRQVAGFIGQESVHGREQRAFNERLAELGYPTKQVEWFTRKGLELRTRFAPPITNLAATAALEHFTATLAELVLTNDEVQKHFGHPAVRDLFVWHALEESEHKAVAFDVYKAVGGSERVRVWTMRAIRIGFVLGMSFQIVASLIRDREAYKPRVLWRSWRNFRKSPLVSRALWNQLKDYDRPDFHPDDRDTTELVAAWREALFGQNGTLNDKLVNAAA
jgi:predicted metal-dependent hydrolase